MSLGGRRHRNSVFIKSLHKLLRCAVSSEYHRSAPSLFLCHLCKLFCHKPVFQPAVGKGLAGKSPLQAAPLPEILVDPVFIVPDQTGCGLQNAAGAPVIGREKYSVLLRVLPVMDKISQEALHHQGICSAESVDGLIIIPHYKKIVCRGGKEGKYLILGGTDILKFVHQNPPEALSPHPEYVRALHEEALAAQDHIIKVQPSPPLHIGIVGPYEFRNPFLCAGKTVFKAADQKLQLFRTCFFRQESRPQITKMLQVSLFGLWIHKAVLFTGRFLENAQKNRMKCTENRFRVRAGMQKAPAHMCRSRPGKCEDQYGGWINAPVFDQIADTLYQNECLSAAGSCNNGTGPRPIMDGGVLCRISLQFISVSSLRLSEKTVVIPLFPYRFF